MPTSSRVLYYLQPSVGATLAVARGRGRAPPLRTTKKPTALLEKVSLRSQCAHWLWQSVLLDLCAGVLRMTLLRCPKFLRCLTADAGNFDRGHSLTSLPLPLAALGSLPTTSLRTGLGMTRKFFRLLSLRGRSAPVAIRIPRPSPLAYCGLSAILPLSNGHFSFSPHPTTFPLKKRP